MTPGTEEFFSQVLDIIGASFSWFSKGGGKIDFKVSLPFVNRGYFKTEFLQCLLPLPYKD